MSAPTINIEENKKLFLDLVGSIERDGIKELVAFLEKSDFFTAPASTRFHCSLPGGLALHSLNVYHMFEHKCKSEPFKSILGDMPEDSRKIFHDALMADYYFMSTNAMTIDGELVNIDGNGNRVAALIYGPENVIILAGMNKVAKDVAEAVDRVHLTATPMNCVRLNKQTPCAVTGVCADCLSPDCICNQVVITRRSGIQGRIKVILIGEELGY